MTTDPLDAVFDTPERLEGERRARLAEMLVPFAVIDPENGTFHPRNAWGSLIAKQKILIFLLARLALSAKNPDFPNGVAPRDIEEQIEIPGGTIRPKLRELTKERIAYKSPDDLYLVRPSTLSFNRAWALLEDKLPNDD